MLHNHEMTRSVRRALAMQYPPYIPGDWEPRRKGECLMPLIAVGAAVWAGYTVATVGIAAMAAFDVITAIGAITAGIGAVTGNQDLMTIGSVMGLAGGIGSFASGSGLFGASEAASEFAGVTEADLAMEVAGEAAGAAVPTGIADAAGEGIINAAEQAIPETSQFTAPEVPEVADTANTAITGTTELQTQPSAGVMDMVKPQGDVTGFTGVGDADLAMEIGKTGSAKTIGGWFDTLKGLGTDFKKFSKENPVVAYSMMQGASNFVGGFFDTMKPAQKDLLEAQAEGLRANTAMTQQQLANIQAPLPRAVTGSPYAGLINSAVTGRV